MLGLSSFLLCFSLYSESQSILAAAAVPPTSATSASCHHFVTMSSQPQQPAVASELKEVEMKTAEPTQEEEEEQAQIEHPLFEEALEEEDVKPESAIEKFKQVIDERQHRHTHPLRHPHHKTRWLHSPSLCIVALFHDRGAADPNGKLVKIKEESIMHLATLYSKQGSAQLCIHCRPERCSRPVVRSSLTDINSSATPLFSRQQDFKTLFVSIRPFFSSIHKSRTAKIVRSLIDTVGLNQAEPRLQAEICQDAISWAEASKRTFLKQRIQTRLAAVYVQMGATTTPSG